MAAALYPQQRNNPLGPLIGNSAAAFSKFATGTTNAATDFAYDSTENVQSLVQGFFPQHRPTAKGVVSAFMNGQDLDSGSDEGYPGGVMPSYRGMIANAGYQPRHGGMSYDESFNDGNSGGFLPPHMQNGPPQPFPAYGSFQVGAMQHNSGHNPTQIHNQMHNGHTSNSHQMHGGTHTSNSHQFGGMPSDDVDNGFNPGMRNSAGPQYPFM